MDPSLALHFLSIAFLLLMIVDDSGARSIKTELQNQKQVEWYKATPVTNDESYGEGYITISESTKPNYKASYTATKHNHHYEKPNHPCKTSNVRKFDESSYSASYVADTSDSNAPYIAGYTKTSDTHKLDQPNYSTSYLTDTHDSNVPYLAGYTKTSDTHKSDQPSNAPYIAGYTKTSDTHKSDQPSNAPYIAGYTKTSDTHKSDQPSNAPYIAGYTKTSNTHKFDLPSYSASYLADTRDSNAPYIAGYKKTNDVHKSDQPNYSASYLTNTHDSNAPYIAGYTKTSDVHKSDQSSYSASYLTDTRDSNAPYIAGYTKTSDTHKSDQPNHSASYFVNTHDSNTPYLAGYKIIRTEKAPKESSNDHLNKPYITQYGGTPKESSNDHLNKPYITQYGGTPKESSNDQITKPYITQYGGTPKESSNDHISKPYITQYGRTDPKNDQKESANIDHTEAFKTGFFALDDLYVGKVMTLQFPIQEVSHFLPRKDAESIPFSTSQLSSVFQLFSIPEDSPEANAIRDTVGQCEAEPITGETKICATSLESMLEFVSSIIGSKAKHNILTTSYATTSSVPLQKYTILEISKDINASKWVACHPLPYPYALYYCHFIATGSKVFKVSLSGENDNKIEALGICHLDTSSWDPNHAVFRQLGITAGKDPVCHFFPVKHLMWVPQPSQASM